VQQISLCGKSNTGCWHRGQKATTCEKPSIGAGGKRRAKEERDGLESFNSAEDAGGTRRSGDLAKDGDQASLTRRVEQPARHNRVKQGLAARGNEEQPIYGNGTMRKME